MVYGVMNRDKCEEKWRKNRMKMRHLGDQTILSSIFKWEDHGDRIYYSRYYGGFEGIGWEKSGSIIMSCYSKHSCINKRVSSSFERRSL